jgi:hypothetical protein
MQLAQQQVPASRSLARVVPLVIAVIGSVGAPLLSAADAHAESTPVVALDINRGSVDTIESTEGFASTPAGAGFDLGLGLRFPGSVWFYTAELTGGFHDFGGALDPTVSRLMLGTRVGLDWIVRPSIFAHLGVGHLSIDDAAQAAVPDIGTDWAGDLGLSLDVRVTPGIEIGAAGSTNWVGLSKSFDWLQAGVHVTFAFGG